MSAHAPSGSPPLARRLATSPASGGGRRGEAPAGGGARLPDWPERLDAVVEAARHRPFAWGTHDCATFAAACIEAVTGTDVLADLPPWRSSDEALRAILHLDGRQRLRAAVDLVMADHGWPAIDPLQAGRGDLCLVAGGLGVFAAICLGSHLAAPAPVGLSLVPRGRALAAWSIGGGSAGLRPAGGRDVRAPSGRAPQEAG